MSFEEWTKHAIDLAKEHRVELDALRRAEEGDPVPLADLILSGAGLNTQNARIWVAARLKGEKQKRGAKRTSGQKMMEFMTWIAVQNIEIKEGVKEYRAIELLCDRNPDLEKETVRTHVRKAKADWEALAEGMQAGRQAYEQRRASEQERGSEKPES